MKNVRLAEEISKLTGESVASIYSTARRLVYAGLVQDLAEGLQEVKSYYEECPPCEIEEWVKK